MLPALRLTASHGPNICARVRACVRAIDRRTVWGNPGDGLDKPQHPTLNPVRAELWMIRLKPLAGAVMLPGRVLVNPMKAPEQHNKLISS